MYDSTELQDRQTERQTDRIVECKYIDLIGIISVCRCVHAGVCRCVTLVLLYLVMADPLSLSGGENRTVSERLEETMSVTSRGEPGGSEGGGGGGGGEY